MRSLLPLLVVIALHWATRVRAKAVFAHFMVGNTADYNQTDWIQDITLAKDAHIDAFALNMAYASSMNENSVKLAFYAANLKGFKLFFSFDYAGNGSWPASTVVEYINRWASDEAYFHYKGQPFVSTFEGPGNATDWWDIKKRTSCFFIPDWSSLGAKAAMAAGNGVADGLFSWAAWPWGNRNMDTYSDASYKQYLNGKPYMMPVSPWFYTNMPGFQKNWLWRGDSIWVERWFQVEWWQPEFVQIISWNDYGESHYIGNLRDKAMEAFDRGGSPFNYALGLEHDGWRDFLPYLIDRYKVGSATIKDEGITAWWRPNPHGACSNGGTTGNTASQLQIEFDPSEMLEDAVFYSALLKSRPSKVEVTVGGVKSFGGWFIKQPEGGAGLYAGSVPLNGRTGAVRIEVFRSDGTSLLLLGRLDITKNCNQGYANYNVHVDSHMFYGGPAITPPAFQDTVCVNGTGVGDFELLCTYTCSVGYCPPTACVCTAMGKQPAQPKDTTVKGYPAEGKDSTYSGLCSVACRLGQCERFKKLGVCDDKEHPLVIPEVSPFLPPYCTSGSGAPYDNLCRFGCKHGYCPKHACTCTSFGHLDLLEPTSISNATTYQGDDFGLCAFACARGFCPKSTCHEILDPLGEYGDDYDPEMDLYVFDMPPEWQCTADVPSLAKSLDDVQKAIDGGDVPPICWNRFALHGLIMELSGLVEQYHDVTEGYDHLFGYYEKWVKDGIDVALYNYLDYNGGKGNKYFDCTYWTGVKTVTQRCPPPQEFWTDHETAWSVKYTLIDDKGFFDAIQNDLGIERDWVRFGDNLMDRDCIGPEGGTDRGRGGGIRRCQPISHVRKNFPIKADDANIHVGNPKAMIEAAGPNITALADTMLQQYYADAVEGGDADLGDLITAAAIPIGLLQGAIDSMAQIKNIGAEVEAAERKRLILIILSVVLMVIPFVGETLGSAMDIALIARIATLIGESGNAALSVYDIVENPAAAPFAILGMLTGAFGMGGKTERQAVKDAADARRALGDLGKLGRAVVAKDQKVQGILKSCLKK